MSIFSMAKFYRKTWGYVPNLTIENPVKLNFVRDGGVIAVGEAADVSQLRTLRRVKATGGHIGILRFDFHLRTTMLPRPGSSVTEKQPADPLAAILGPHAQVPQDRQVAAAFEHVDPGRVAGQDGAAQRRAVFLHSQEKAPVFHIEPARPIQWGMQLVIIFDVSGHGLLAQ